MLKSVKAIILASVTVSMSVMLINSCGVSSPTGTTGSTGAATQPNALYALTTTPLSPIPPILLPSFTCGMSQADIISLLGNQYANPNATGPYTPYNQLCGDYQRDIAWVQAPTDTGWSAPFIFYDNLIHIHHFDIYFIDHRTDPMASSYKPYHYYHPNNKNVEGLSGYPIVLNYSIPCNDPLFVGKNLPSDYFLGNGYPPGDYIDCNGIIYTKHPDGTVTAKSPDPQTPRTLLGIYISPASISCSVGTTVPVTATAIYNKPDPTNNLGISQDITTSIVSGDTAIATISNGTLTPVQSGTTMLSVTFGGYTAFSYIDVKLPRPDSIVVEPANYSMAKGDTKQYIAKAHYTNNPSLVMDITKNPSTNWAVGYTGITKPASINNTGYDKGTATGLAPGTAVISASYDGVNSNNATLTILDKKLSSIKVDPATPVTLYLHPTKGTQQYTATGTFSDTSSKPLVAPVTWDTLPGGIASIDANGLATAVAPGTTYITAASDSSKSGLNDAELCVKCWQSQQYWLQNDATWYNDLYATYTAPQYYMYSIGNRQIWYGTIGGTGCAMTCIAMALTTTGTSYTPRQLNQDMISQGYYNVNDVNFDTLVDFSNGAIKNWYYTSKYNIKTELDKCNIVIVMVHNSENKCAHWVYITGYKGDTYYIHDPANTNRTTKTINDICETGKSVAIAVPN